MGSPPRQYTHENDCVTGCWASISAMVRRIAVPVNRSFDGSLSRLTPLVRRSAQDGRGGYAGSVAGQDVNEPRWERPHPADVAGQIGELFPSVENVTADLLIDGEPHRLGLKCVFEPAVTLLEDARTQRAERHARAQRFLQMGIGVEIEAPAQFGEEVNDLGERELERRAGRRSWPDEFVEVEFRCRESAVIRDLRSIRAVCAPVRGQRVGRPVVSSVIP